MFEKTFCTLSLFLRSVAILDSFIKAIGKKNCQIIACNFLCKGMLVRGGTQRPLVDVIRSVIRTGTIPSSGCLSTYFAIQTF